MTVNMGRAVATLAGHGLAEATLATLATLQRTLLAVPARLARSARRYHLHLPVGWSWQTQWQWCGVRHVVGPGTHPPTGEVAECGQVRDEEQCRDQPTRAFPW
jgi:hypothetical protein